MPEQPLSEDTTEPHDDEEETLRRSLVEPPTDPSVPEPRFIPRPPGSAPIQQDPQKGLGGDVAFKKDVTQDTVPTAGGDTEKHDPAKQKKKRSSGTHLLNYVPSDEDETLE